MLRTEHVFTLEGSLGPVVEVGPTPYGSRRVILIIGGVVSRGLDGVAVAVTNAAELARGDEPPFLTSPSFEVGAEGPVWLRSGVLVGVLRPGPTGDAVHIDVHRVALDATA